MPREPPKPREAERIGPSLTVFLSLLSLSSFVCFFPSPHVLLTLFISKELFPLLLVAKSQRVAGGEKDASAVCELQGFHSNSSSRWSPVLFTY